MKKIRIQLSSVILSLLIASIFMVGNAQSTNLETTYIEAWKQFYPSKAFAQGIQTTIFDYEDLSADNIEKWLSVNKKILAELDGNSSSYPIENPIDSRLLKVQIQAEIYQWETAPLYKKSLGLYTRLIARATNNILDVNYLTAAERARLICQRLTAVQKLSNTAIQHLEADEQNDLEKGIQQLQAAVQFYEQGFRDKIKHLSKANNCPATANTTKAIQQLINHVKTNLLPNAIAKEPIIGRTEFARRLVLYTDSDLTPERLEKMTLTEIETVRNLIAEVSRDYLKQTYPNQSFGDKSAVIKAAFADMEKDAPTNGEDYLQFWLALEKAATQFIVEKDIATLPEYQTLRIIPAPESAGAAARIGWVDSAPPFAANPLTTLYLPSIPDTLPEQEQKDFWASFNKPFNRMIVIHELYPGHYMQIKISRETPHPVRLLFPYKPYFEGWATFTERVLLDAGWEKERPLTFLAHLRKRLENANRTYTSIQVHCNNWTAEQVMDFSINQSLLAPQFAKSLWGRIMRSPMQLTSYFLGGKQFTELLAAEQKRLGNQFVLKDFMDTIMRIGPIPIDEFRTIFEQQQP